MTKEIISMSHAYEASLISHGLPALPIEIELEAYFWIGIDILWK